MLSEMKIPRIEQTCFVWKRTKGIADVGFRIADYQGHSPDSEDSQDSIDSIDSTDSIDSINSLDSPAELTVFTCLAEILERSHFEFFFREGNIELGDFAEFVHRVGLFADAQGEVVDVVLV